MSNNDFFLDEVNSNSTPVDLEDTEPLALDVEAKSKTSNSQTSIIEEEFKEVLREQASGEPNEDSVAQNEDQAQAQSLLAAKDVENLITKLKAEREKVNAEAEALSEEIMIKREEAESFANWVDRHRRTFLWKMLSRMDVQKDLIKIKQTEYEETVNNIELPVPGELVRYRKRFHKTVLSALAGVSMASLIWWLLITYVPFAWVSTLALETLRVITYLVSLFLSLFLGALLLYYRDWRRFDWKVKLLNRQLRDVAEGVDHVRREEVRIVSLYPQVKDWLEIIGYSLNRPWSMNERWFKSYIADLNQDEFPFSLRIAQAQEKDAASMHELQGNTMKRFAVRGWRTQVMKDQILAIGQKVGLPLDRMTIEGVDQDISYSPGGPRNELRKGLENVEALELVARRQLIPLTFKVQSEEITKSRPPVKENRTNALDAIQADFAGLEEEERVDWDKFLKEPIGPFNGVITPFSLASFAKGEIIHGYHEKMKSYFVVPQRLQSFVLSNPDARVETYQESANLPMDIVIRMDLSEKIPPHAIKINPKPESTSVPKLVSEQVTRHLTDSDHDDD